MTEQGKTEMLQRLLEKAALSPAYQQGNADTFSPDNVELDPSSPLMGKTAAFLGSSVTYGFAAKGVSFVDYLAARDGLRTVKSTISGTTLAGQSADGYLTRLKRDIPGGRHYDLLVCQLSTNDQRQGKRLGEVTGPDQRQSFDTETTLGAIEEVCRYGKNTLHCPLIFYTCLVNDSTGAYAQLIAKLRKLQKKWGFAIIDLFNNQGLQASIKAHPHAMFDDVHPTQEGYLKVWLPVFEQELAAIVQKN